MFGYAVKHHSKRADMEVKNNAQLTPLTLSSKLGRNEIFKEIIELQSIVSTSSWIIFSPMASGHPVDMFNLPDI